jgi:histone-lysine N-methyltransferase SETD1
MNHLSENGKEESRLSVKKLCPKYQPGNYQYLKDPSLRRDDATAFIEDAMAVKTLMPEPDEPIIDETGVSWKRKRPSETESTSSECIERRRYKCGLCSTVQYNPLGCIRCRRDQLVKETATRDIISPSSIKISADFLNGSKALSHSHNYDEGFLKSKCVMLHHTTVGEISEDKAYSDELTKEYWTPNAILPPVQTHLQLPTENELCQGSDASSEIEDDDSSIASDSTGTSRSDSNAKSLADDENIYTDSIKDAHILRQSRRTADDSANRQIMAKKHKESADELTRKCLSIACSGILMGMLRRDPLRLFAKPAPASMEEYHKVIKDPIDFQTMRQKLLSNEYGTLGSFVNDAKRLCINACVFNAADSLYALTAKEIFDSLVVMIKRAQQWLAILKNTHASYFISNDDNDDGCTKDMFKDVEAMWPGAVELLNSGSWLEQEAQKTDFVRTRENEMAYYGALSLRRAAVAACESSGPGERPVTKRSHIEDELLRERINSSVSLLDGPACLKDHPDWREEQLLKLLKTVQKQRIEVRSHSEAGCARCDIMNGDHETISMWQNSSKSTSDTTKNRVDPSRSFQTTGLASRNARSHNASASEESRNESMVSVKGSDIHGWGLFSDCNFKQGDIVAEYIGEYISIAVADVREKYYRKQRIQDYQFRVNEKVVIDATLKGSYARYINHSCQPNCKARIMEGEPPNAHLMRVLIIAKRDIDAGEELSYDYHFPLETDLSKRVPCNCRSPKCR